MFKSILCEIICAFVGCYIEVMEQSVPKRRHIKFRRRGFTQKKSYSIQNTAKVSNQELPYYSPTSLEFRGVILKTIKSVIVDKCTVPDWRCQRASMCRIHLLYIYVYITV